MITTYHRCCTSPFSLISRYCLYISHHNIRISYPFLYIVHIPFTKEKHP